MKIKTKVVICAGLVVMAAPAVWFFWEIWAAPLRKQRERFNQQRSPVGSYSQHLKTPDHTGMRPMY